MLSGWLSLVFANQLCWILMRELTASYSACVPSNRSLSSESHLHGRRLCFVGKDFTICHSLCQPTPPQPNLLSLRVFLVFCKALEYPPTPLSNVHKHTHTHTRQSHCLVLYSGQRWWCNIINRTVVFQVGRLSSLFLLRFSPTTPTVSSSLKWLSVCCRRASGSLSAVVILFDEYCAQTT